MGKNNEMVEQPDLGLIVKLLAALLVQGKSKKDSIHLLGNLGLSRNLIAEILETTPLTVSVTLSQKRKANAGSAKAE